MASGSKDTGGKQRFVPPALAEDPVGLPPGKYKLVAWELITTGRRLIDEICHIAAYAPFEMEYSQFIMPNGNLNPSARRRNDLRIVTIGRYRMLKDTVTQKAVKSKSAFTALFEFLNWLEANKSEDEKIILLYHEPRRLYPKMIIQTLIRYNLLERFESIVAGFTDSYNMSLAKCNNITKSVALRVLTTMLLEENRRSLTTALDRAKATYNIMDQIANNGGEVQDGAAGGEGAERAPTKNMMQLAIQYARPIHTEVKYLETVQNLLERQKTFRPVMRPLMRLSRAQRRRVTQLRRMLTDAGLVLYLFKDAWHEDRRAGMERLISPLEETGKAEDIQEILEIFEKYFDAKQAAGHQPEPEEGTCSSIYSSSDDSDSSGPVSSTYGFVGSAAAIPMVEEAVDN